MPRQHDFLTDLAFSEGVELSGQLYSALARIVPAFAGVERATTRDDKNGTDLWVTRHYGLPPISVDVKHRRECPIKKYNSDDACIEICSVHIGRECRKPGWTVDDKKRTDYIAYTWPSDSGIRFWIVPFHPLCSASKIHKAVWIDRYKLRPTENNGYITQCVYPPRKEIARAMALLMRSAA